MTDWDQRYLTGDTPWEKGQPSPALLDLLDKRLDWGPGPLLVPGCGLGHDVRALGMLGIPVVGLDISPSAVALAREFPPTGDQTYEVGDFLDPAWRAGREFSAIWEHTCFCAIDLSQRASYAQAVAGCLPQGGLLAGVFYLTPYDPDEDDTGPPFGVTIAELDEWFTPAFERLDGWVPQAAFPGREGREWIGLYRRRDLLKEHTAIRDEDLRRKIREIDKRDGVEDGRLLAAPLTCPKCHATVTAGALACLTCGATIAPKYPYAP